MFSVEITGETDCSPSIENLPQVVLQKLPVGRFICGDEFGRAGRHVDRDGLDVVEFQRQVRVVVHGGFNQNGGASSADAFPVGSVHSVVLKRGTVAGSEMGFSNQHCILMVSVDELHLPRCYAVCGPECVDQRLQSSRV
ncbi:hypothetical protein Trydic_g1797 [Trypoxylus dichotomus]